MRRARGSWNNIMGGAYDREGGVWVVHGSCVKGRRERKKAVRDRRASLKRYTDGNTAREVDVAKPTIDADAAGVGGVEIGTRRDNGG